MAKSYNLTMQLNLQGPPNVKGVTSKLKKELSNIGGIKLEINNKSLASLDSATKKLKVMSSVLSNASANAAALQKALGGMSAALGKSSALLNSTSKGLKDVSSALNTTANASKKAEVGMSGFLRTIKARIAGAAAFQVINKTIAVTGNLINEAATSFVAYERNLNRVKQVSRDSDITIGNLSKTIRALAQDLGVSSLELSQVSVTLAQTGLAANQVQKALKTLAQASLTPTFTNMNDAVEGAIAVMSQFKITAGGLEKSFDSINTVASKFAVEFDDIVSAIQRGGGAFAAAASDARSSQDALNQYIALFTTARATTRESSETIATGIRTITARLQKLGTQKKIKDLIGVDLTDAQGNFVGAYKAIELISNKVKELNLSSASPQFSQLVESIGGIRQISRVIPLLTEVETRTKAYADATAGVLKSSDTAAFAQDTLAVQLQKTREAWNDLIGAFGSSSGFKALATTALTLTRAFASLAKAFVPLAPLFAVLAAGKAVKSITSGGGLIGGLLGGAGKSDGGYIQKFARGGVVPGSGNRDTVPAMLTPGEFVIRKNAVKALGTERLHKMNKYAGGGPISKENSVGAIILSGNAGRTGRNTISKDLILEQFGNAATQKTLEGSIPDDKTFELVRNPLSRDKAPLFTKAINDGLIQAVNTSSNQLAQDLGMPENSRAIKDKVNRTAFLSSVNDGARGNLFEQLIDAAAKTASPLYESSGAQDPFDFVGPLGASLDALFPDVSAITYKDGKASYTAASPDNFAKKIGNQLLSELGQTSGAVSKSLNDQASTAFERLKQSLKDGVAGKNQVKTILAGGNTPNRSHDKIYDDLKAAGYITETPKPTGQGFDVSITKGYASGGSVSDTVPAMLTPGEFVINKKAAAKIGGAQLERLNKADKIQGFNKGGVVQHFASGGSALGILARSNGLGLDKFEAQLRKNIRDLAKSISDAVKKSKDDFVLGVSKVQTKLAAGGSTKEAKKAAEALVEELAKNSNIKDKSLIGAAKTDLKSGIRSGGNIQDIISNSASLSAIFNQTVTSAESLDRALDQLSIETGIAKNDLSKINTGGLVTKTVDRLNKSLDSLTNRLANSRIGQFFQSEVGTRFREGLVRAGNTVQGFTVALAAGISSFNALFPNLGTTDAGKTASETASGAAAGGIAGAQIGRILGPEGAAVGAIVGAIAGGFSAYARSSAQRDIEQSQRDLAETTEKLDAAMSDLTANTSSLTSAEKRKRAVDAIGANARQVRSLAVQAGQRQRGVLDIGSYFSGQTNQQTSEYFDIFAEGIIQTLNATSQFSSVALEASGNINDITRELELLEKAQAPDAQKTDRDAALLNGSLVNTAVRINRPDFDTLAPERQEEERKKALQELALAAYLDKQKLSGEDRTKTEARLKEDPRKLAEALAQGEKELARREELRLSSIKVARSLGVLQNAMKDFDMFLSSIKNVNERYLTELDVFEKRARARIDGVFGGGDVLGSAVGTLQKQKASLENPLNVREFKNTMETVFGQGSSLTSVAVGGQAIKAGLAPLLRSTTEQNQESVIDQVENLIISSTGFNSLDDMPDDVRSAVESLIDNTSNAIRTPETTNFNDLADQIGSFVDANARAATEAAIAQQDKFIKQLEFINRNIEQQIAISRQILAQDISSAKINAEFNLQAMDALGVLPSLEQMNAGFNAEIRNLTGGLTDPADIGAEIGDRLNQNRALEGRQQQLAAQPQTPQTVQELANIAQIMGRNNFEIQNQTAALEMIENNTEAQNNAFKKFAEEQKRASDQRTFIDKALFGDFDDRLEVMQEIEATAAARAGDEAYFARNPGAGRIITSPNSLLSTLGPEAQRAGENVAYRGVAGDFAPFIKEFIDRTIVNARGNPNNRNFIEAQAARDQRLAAAQQRRLLFQQQGALNDQAIDAIIGDPNLDPAVRQQLLIDNFFLRLNRDYPSIVQEAYRSLVINAQQLNLPAPVQRNSGGIIHSSGGGTGGPNRDTVPAMLTPGEFVVNREATQKNLGLLKSLNAGTQGGYNRGGVVYLNDGSDRPVGLPGSLQRSRSDLADRQEKAFFDMLFAAETYGGNPDYQNFEAQFAGKFGSTYGHPKFERYERIFKEKQRSAFNQGLDTAIEKSRAEREAEAAAQQAERDRIAEERAAAQRAALEAERERRASEVERLKRERIEREQQEKVARTREYDLEFGKQMQDQEDQAFAALPKSPMAATLEYLERMNTKDLDSLIYKAPETEEVNTLIPARSPDVFPEYGIITDKTKEEYLRRHDDVGSYILEGKFGDPEDPRYPGIERYNENKPFEQQFPSVQEYLQAEEAMLISLDKDRPMKVSSAGLEIVGHRTRLDGKGKEYNENLKQFINPDRLLNSLEAPEYISALDNSWESVLRNRKTKQAEEQRKLDQIQEQERLEKEARDREARADATFSRTPIEESLLRYHQQQAPKEATDILSRPIMSDATSVIPRGEGYDLNETIARPLGLAAGATAIGVAEGVVPGSAGATAFGLTTAATAPVLGPFAPVAGLAASLIVGGGTYYAQSKILDNVTEGAYADAVNPFIEAAPGAYLAGAFFAPGAGAAGRLGTKLGTRAPKVPGATPPVRTGVSSGRAARMERTAKRRAGKIPRKERRLGELFEETAREDYQLSDLLPADNNFIPQAEASAIAAKEANRIARLEKMVDASLKRGYENAPSREYLLAIARQSGRKGLERHRVQTNARYRQRAIDKNESTVSELLRKTNDDTPPILETPAAPTAPIDDFLPAGRDITPEDMALFEADLNRIFEENLAAAKTQAAPTSTGAAATPGGLPRVTLDTEQLAALIKNAADEAVARMTDKDKAGVFTRLLKGSASLVGGALKYGLGAGLPTLGIGAALYPEEARIIKDQLMEYIRKQQENASQEGPAFDTGAGLNVRSPVYANRGMFVPKGTDTVPAMLTPGEFVVNRQATQENFGLLQRINNGETLYKKRGGVIYRQFGGMADQSGAGGSGMVSIDLNMEQFTSAVSGFSGSVTLFKTGSDNFVSTVANFTNKINSFSTYVDKLSNLKIPTLPDQIYLFGTHTVNVTVTGAAAFEALEDKLKQLINKETGKEMSRLWQQSGGALGSPP